MENFKQIDKCDVWPHLQAGKNIFAVIFKSRKFTECLRLLNDSWSVREINSLLSDNEKNVVFYEEVTE